MFSESVVKNEILGFVDKMEIIDLSNQPINQQSSTTNPFISLTPNPFIDSPINISTTNPFLTLNSNTSNFSSFNSYPSQVQNFSFNNNNINNSMSLIFFFKNFF
jgi:hypothetical protein